MGLLDGLRGGQYLGFTTGNVPVIDLMKIAPQMTVPKQGASSASSGKGDEFDINSYKGDASNFIANIESANMDMSEGRRKMQQGVMLAQSNPEEGTRLLNEGNSQFIKGRTNYTIAKAVKPTIEYHREQMTRAIEPYEQNRIALDQSGKRAINFKGDGETSISDPRAYDYEQQPVRFSGYNMFQDAVTQDYPSWNFKTNTPGQNPYNSPTGSLKGTNYLKTLEERYRGAKGVSDIISKITPNLGITDLGGYDVIVNSSRIDKNENNNRQINAINNTAYELTTDEERTQIRQEVWDNIYTNKIAAMVDYLKPIGPFESKENAQAYVDAMLEKEGSNTPYKYLITQEVKDKDGNVTGYDAMLSPINLNGSDRELQLSYEEASKEKYLPYYEKQLVANNAYNMAGIYNFNKKDITYYRNVTNPPKGGSGGAGKKDLVDMMSVLAAASSRMISGTNISVDNFSYLTSGNTETGLNRKVVKFGQNYKLNVAGTPVQTNNVFFAKVGDQRIAITGFGGWKVKQDLGYIGNAPNVGIRSDIAPEYFYEQATKNVNNTFSHILSPVGTDSNGNELKPDLIGYSGSDAAKKMENFYNSPVGIMPISDLGSLLKNIDNIDNSKLSSNSASATAQKNIYKNLFTELNSFGIDPIASSSQMANVSRKYQELVNKYHTEISKISGNLNAAELKLLKDNVDNILNNAGSIAYYKATKDSYGNNGFNSNTQTFSQPTSFMANAKTFGENRAYGDWGDKFDTGSLFYGAMTEYTFDNNMEGFKNNYDNIPVYLKSGGQKDGVHSLKELITHYGYDLDDFDDAFREVSGKEKSIYEIISIVVSEIENKENVDIVLPFNSFDTHTIVMEGDLDYTSGDASSDFAGEVSTKVFENYMRDIKYNNDFVFQDFIQKGYLEGSSNNNDEE